MKNMFVNYESAKITLFTQIPKKYKQKVTDKTK